MLVGNFVIGTQKVVEQPEIPEIFCFVVDVVSFNATVYSTSLFTDEVPFWFLFVV